MYPNVKLGEMRALEMIYSQAQEINKAPGN